MNRYGYIIGTPGRVIEIEPGTFTTISIDVEAGTITQGLWPADRPTLRKVLYAAVKR